MAGPEILAQFGEGFGTITLNRASKLNALNLNMIRLLHLAMDDVDRRAGKLGCFIMDGAGGKAFCAGGDVAAVRAEALAGGSLPNDFFYEEYAVVGRLAAAFERTGCCQVSLWDGVTMGGGVGLSVKGPIRVCTEKTSFAKPEMNIGLFPDVGSTQTLGRLALGPNVGVYLGATGTRLKAWDLLRTGLATHYVPSSALPKLRQLLAEKFAKGGLVGPAAKTACEEALREAAAGATPSSDGAIFTDENVAIIDRCFSADTLEEIMTRLAADSSAFAKETHKIMLTSCSPTSCKVTIRAVRELSAKGVSFAHCLKIEYRLAQRFTLRPQPHSDFHEGIRAVLIDKDRKQKWSPAWNELDKIDVDSFFAPLEGGHRRGELELEDISNWGEAKRQRWPEPIMKAKL